MLRVRVAGAALNQTPRDWKGNRVNIVQAIKEAREHKASLLVLNELGISGYGCEDDFYAQYVHKRSAYELKQLLPFTRGMVVAIGLPVLFNNALFNCVAVIADGALLGLSAKMRLANSGVFYEARQFHAWPEGIQQTVTLPHFDYSVPIGDQIYSIGGIRFGLETCEEAWGVNRSGGPNARKAVDIIGNASASNFSFGKLQVRQRIVLEGSRAFNVVYIYSNLNGLESGRNIYDGGTMIASGGEMITQGPRFSFKNVVVTSAIVDIDKNRTEQARTGSYQPDIDHANTHVITVPFEYPTDLQSDLNQPVPAWETSKDIKFEEFTRAETLATLDYIRKSHSKGSVISLSGGADSTAVTAICHLGVNLGCFELGAFAFVDKFFPHLSGKIKATTFPKIVEEIARETITTAYQATAQSGKVTENAAMTVAQLYSTTHWIFNVEEQSKAYIAIGSKVMGETLSWEKHRMALENVQARTRSPGIWIIANLEGKLLITTSNRSEAAVGYCTMDGDSSGGLAVLAGIDKTFVREWLKWLEKTGPEGVGPAPSLRCINEQAPTAELMPSDFHQTDEKDLMPYPILNEIEGLLVQDRNSPLEIFELLYEKYGDDTASAQASTIIAGKLSQNERMDIIAGWIAKFFRLYARNQWKRERYAVSFHLDSRNLDPRSWNRVAILNSGYEEELQELRDHVDSLKVQTVLEK